MFKKFREEAVSEGYMLETILNEVVIHFVPCDNMSAAEIEIWENILFNGLKSKGQCRFNTAKRTYNMDFNTMQSVIDQDYLTA